VNQDKLTSSEKFSLIEEIFELTENADPSNQDYDKLYVDKENLDSKLAFLKELDKQGIISLILPLSNDHLELALMDQSKLAIEYRKAYIGNLHKEEPATIIYNPHAGICSVNGHEQRLKDRNKRIFTLLFNNANKPLDKGTVWRAAGRRGTPQDDNDTIIFNSYITNLRRALNGISPDQLRLNKTVELWAYTYLTDENDLITEKVSTI